MSIGHRSWPFALVALGCASSWQATCSGNDEAVSVANGNASSALSSSSSSSTSTSGSGGGDAGAALDPCRACGQPENGGVLASAAVNEASGLAASRAHDGIYYVNNDSGDSPRFFAIDASGAERGIYHVAGAQAVDWEGMAVGPCDRGASCIYVGDIGDNLRGRSEYVVYRVREPLRIAGGEHTLPGDALLYVYPDGSHNAETVLADPENGDLFIVTKVEQGISALYRFPMPLTPGETVTLEKLTSLSPPSGSPKITGGDIHPARLGVLLRTYTHLWFYGMNGSVADALATMPCALPAATEQQGETVAWTAAGDGYLTVSEGAGSTLFASHCGP